MHAHLAGRDDGLTSVAPVLSRFPDFADLLDLGPDETAFARLRRAERVDRPLGDDAFIGSGGGDSAPAEARQTWPSPSGRCGRQGRSIECTVTVVPQHLGRLTGITCGNGANTTLGYDGASRITPLAHSFINTAANVSWTFTYDAPTAS